MPAPSTTVIAARSGFIGVGLRELWAYRELLLFLAWRNILVRYKQTFLGLAWALIQPFALMIVLTIFFGRLAKVPSNGAPFAISMYAALVPWTFFASTMGQSASSLVANANLLSKVYFPRIALPMSTIISAFVDFLVASLLLVALMAWYDTWPSLIALAVVPGMTVVLVATALGVGLWLAALNVRYRDVQYVVPFVTQIWFFATVVYPLSLLHSPWHKVVGLNPLAGVVEGYRWALLGTTRGPGWMMAISAGVAAVLVVSGALYFRRVERTFADII